VNGADTATFPTEVEGLPDCGPTEIVRLADGDIFELRIAPVAKTLNGRRVRMLGYNGSIPGPTLRVQQGSDITVVVRNDSDYATTVHWHGLRLDNRFDGVAHGTQAPIPIGGWVSNGTPS
jgi:FtsP/CotA-like multicopper oxidase with cupredoxin domain